MRFSKLATVLLPLIPMATFPQTSAATSARLEGRVLDSAGRPVKAARVYASPTENLPGGRRIVAATGSDGSFELDNVRPGEVMIHAYKEEEGYPDTLFAFYATSASAVPKLKVAAGQKVGGIVIRLGPKAALLTISLEDAENHRSYAAAQITMCRRDEPTYCLNTAVSNLAPITLPVPPVPITLSAVARGYNVIVPSAPLALDLNSGSKKGIIIKLARNSSLAGPSAPPH